MQEIYPISVMHRYLIEVVHPIWAEPASWVQQQDQRVDLLPKQRRHAVVNASTTVVCRSTSTLTVTVPASTTTPPPIQQRSSSRSLTTGRLRRPFICGRYHNRGACPAYGKQRRNCGQINHFAVKCRQGRPPMSDQQPQSPLSSKLYTKQNTKEAKWANYVKLLISKTITRFNSHRCKHQRFRL